MRCQRYRALPGIACVLLASLGVFSSLAKGAAAADHAAAATLPAEVVQAIRDGNSERLPAFLTGGGDVNTRDSDGNTPLILAALYSKPDVVEFLLKKGADANAANRAGATALIRAATDPAKARLLLDAGAKAQVRTELGNTPLILAARRHGNSATVKRLLERGADASATNVFGIGALHTAAASGDLDSVRLLMEHGADVNAYPELKVPTHELAAGMRTPLMWAAYRNDVRMVRLLLDRGADPNKGSSLGTPLSHAAWHNSTEAAQLLIDRGARVDERDRVANFTALHWASSTDTLSPQFVKLLLAKGADPNAGGGDSVPAFLTVQQTPVMIAAKRGRTALVMALIAAGATSSATSAAPRVPATRSLPDHLENAVVADAAERAVAALQVTAAKSVESFARHASQQDCVSCHQQYLPMAAVGHARERALTIDKGAAQEQIELIHRKFQKAKDPFFMAEPGLQATFHPDPAFSFGYEAFGLASEKVPPRFLTDVRVQHLAMIQSADGRWEVNLPRPPIQSGDVGATALALLTIKNYGWPARKDEFAACIDRGRNWLRSVQAETNEEAALQLLGLSWAGEPAEKLSGLAEALVKKQREDGGWSQLPTLESDAYATGQALYALARAAKLPATDRAWQRGLRFLLATQHDGGTWHVSRRAFPFQPTMPSGFPHGRDAWVSAAATSWAVLALTQAVEPGSETKLIESKAAIAAADIRPATSAAQIDFVKQIKPVLERSCLACHSGERPQSGFRVDSRAALLKRGASGEPAIVAGRSERSPLIQYVSDPEALMEMPPPERRDRFPALSKDEVHLLRAWIDQGAEWPKDVTLTPRAGGK
ncbi:MAG: ankyrin repeat domain-containing protein [Planctomycetia bacterium]|nr:ankyrin repeat domain-containing protein [Planctomycetia bacterium]